MADCKDVRETVRALLIDWAGDYAADQDDLAAIESGCEDFTQWAAAHLPKRELTPEEAAEAKGDERYHHGRENH